MCSCTTKETVALSFKITINLLKTLQDQRVSTSINLLKPPLYTPWLHTQPVSFFFSFLFFAFFTFFFKINKLVQMVFEKVHWNYSLFLDYQLKMSQNGRLI